MGKQSRIPGYNAIRTVSLKKAFNPASSGLYSNLNKRAGFLWRLEESYVKTKEQVVRLLTA